MTGVETPICMATYRGSVQISKFFKNDNDNFTVGEERYKYRKRKNLNEPHGDGLELEALV